MNRKLMRTVGGFKVYYDTTLAEYVVTNGEESKDYFTDDFADAVSTATVMDIRSAAGPAQIRASKPDATPEVLALVQAYWIIALMASAGAGVTLLGMFFNPSSDLLLATLRAIFGVLLAVLAVLMVNRIAKLEHSYGNL